jgi:hypothetical protein
VTGTPFSPCEPMKDQVLIIELDNVPLFSSDGGFFNGIRHGDGSPGARPEYKTDEYRDDALRPECHSVLIVV